VTVPACVISAVEAVLEDRMGRPTRVRVAAPVGGGCINPSARLETEEGEAFFLKWNDSAPPDMFPAEADGLHALATPGTIRVPEVMGWGGQSTRTDPGWLLLEFVPRGPPAPEYGRSVGEGLARLHASAGSRTSSDSPSFGWHRDNFIGSLPQGNREAGNWALFWRDRRIGAQLRLSRRLGYFGGKDGQILDRLLSQTGDILSMEGGHGPALIHGDLWSGNYFPDSSGAPVLIDPAVYRGDGEVDLAMMELFGSFPGGFLDGYESIRPISLEYRAFRRDLYQLYYLLVHVNLFGGSYVGGSVSAARRVLAEV